MENETANDNAQNVEGSDQTADTTEQVDVEALKAKAAKADELENTNRQLFERAKKAEGFVKVDGKWVKAPKPEEAVRATGELQSKTGELQDAQLDFFELKGYSDEAEIDVLKNIMKRTGMSHREVIKDEYALAKIKSIRDENAVKAATPSGSKRSSQGQTDDVAYWVEKNERTGEWPTDFKLKAKIVEAKERKAGVNAPSWRQ